MEIQAARYKIKAIFRNSEGWKETLPNLIQRVAPPKDKPILGKKTMAVKTKTITRTRGVHFLIVARGKKKHNPPSRIPGSSISVECRRNCIRSSSICKIKTATF